MNRWTSRLSSILVLAFLAVAVPAQSGQSGGQSSEPPGGKSAGTITLPAGSTISVRIADAVNSGKNHSGDLLTGIVDPSVLVDNRVVIPRGTEAHVRLIRDKKGGHVDGKAEVRLELVSLILNGQQLSVETTDYDKRKGAMKGKAENGAKSAGASSIDTAAAAGPGGAIVGGVIGIFSAPKIELQPNSRVEFSLAQPFTFIPPAPPSPPGS